MFVDPDAETDAGGNPMDPASLGLGRSSDLGRLFDAWGIEYNPVQVVLDPQYALQVQPPDPSAAPVRNPSLLGLNSDSIMVSGPKSILKKMKSILTERKTYNNLSEKIVERIEVKKLRGFSYSADNLLMSLDVQAIIDKSFEEIPVKVLNVPPDREVVLIPNSITVSVIGGIEVLGKLSEYDFSASIEYSEVVVDSTGTVAPEIDFPDNTQLIYIKPERLRYVITKFN